MYLVRGAAEVGDVHLEAKVYVLHEKFTFDLSGGRRGGG